MTPPQLLSLGLALALVAGSGCRKKNDSADASKPGADKTASQSAVDLAGPWNGELEVAPTIKLRLVTHFTAAAQGSYTATMDSPDQGAKGMPVSSVLINGAEVRLEVESINGAYHGTLNPKGDQISGTWEQGGKKLPIIFHKGLGEETVPESDKDYTFAKGSPADVRGYWKGTLDAKGTKIRLGLKISRDKKGGYSGTLDSMDQGIRDLSISSIVFTNGSAQLQWKLLNATYQGTLNPAADSLTGTWIQMGQPLPMTFARQEKSGEGKFIDQPGLSFVPESGKPADVRGFWKGQLDLKEFHFNLALKIARAQDGSYLGALDNLDMGTKDLPMSSVTQTNGAVSLEWKAIGASFKGKVAKDGRELTGIFEQMGKKAPMTFARQAQAAD